MTREQLSYQFNFHISNATEKLKQAKSILDNVKEDPPFQCPYASKPKWDNKPKKWNPKTKMFEFI